MGGESYSALTVAVADGDDDLIAAPLGRVHFAGEHTAGAWAGLMEGALRSAHAPPAKFSPMRARSGRPDSREYRAAGNGCVRSAVS